MCAQLSVLFVSLPPAPGGSVHALRSLLAALAGRVHRVVATPDGTPAWAVLAPHIDELVPIVGNRRRRLAGQVSVWRQAARFATSHQIEAVHANGLAEVPAAARAARVAKVPLLVWVHGTEVPTGTRLLAPGWRWMAQSIRWVGVSEFSRELLSGAGLATPDEVTIIDNPIDPEVVADRPPPEVPVTIGYLGGASHRKGFDLVVKTVDALIGEPLRWLIVTGRRVPAEFQLDVARLATMPAVDLLDHTDRVAEIYARCHLVLVPSREESFGRVAAEAMLNHKPVVASDIPALREVLEGGRAGELFAPGDAEAAAAAIRTLASDPDRRRSLGETGAGIAARYNPDRVADRFVELYRQGMA